MHIIVIGNGKIGSTITEQLSAEGHDIVVIDNSEARAADAQNLRDIIAIHGNGATRAVQLKAGAQSADLLIAVTNDDEVNLLCCLVAKKLGTKYTIARVRNPEYSDDLALMRDELGLSLTINPDFNAAQDIFSVLRFPGVLNVEKFSKGRVEIAEFRLPKDSPLASLDLIEISRRHKIKFLICAVRRDEETFIPSGGFTLMPDDRISFVAAPEESEKLLRTAGIAVRTPKKVIIVGAGRISHYLARMLRLIGVHPTIIDRSIDKCKQISAHLPDCLVIHGDGSDRELLAEEGIDHADAFVAATDTDEINILLSMYATSVKVPKVVTKVSRFSIVELVGDEKLGSIISPKEVSADQVISYVRALESSAASNVETLYRVVDNTVEALEFNVREPDKRLLDIPLKDLNLRKNLLIGCIIRHNKIIVPNGQDCIKLGDRLIVVTTILGLSDLHNILA